MFCGTTRKEGFAFVINHSKEKIVAIKEDGTVRKREKAKQVENQDGYPTDYYTIRPERNELQEY